MGMGAAAGIPGNLVQAVTGIVIALVLVALLKGQQRLWTKSPSSGKLNPGKKNCCGRGLCPAAALKGKDVCIMAGTVHDVENKTLLTQEVRQGRPDAAWQLESVASAQGADRGRQVQHERGCGQERRQLVDARVAAAIFEAAQRLRPRDGRISPRSAAST